ncbi:lithostathine-like [Mugil cephalus]|uniref:lithostathine-like n=1 Tax=Mugil cephalus TaxID=48193 RepID=UPI001FB709F7|nr:lithostathine-like [Mugil cephalus]
MDYGLFFIALSGALVSITFAQSHQYYFVNEQLNWTEAQRFCRNNFTDLATIENIADVNAVTNTGKQSDYTGKAWIGLYDDLVNSWRWSLNDSSFYGEGETMYRNWYSNQPNNLGGQQYCVALIAPSPYLGTWFDIECSVQWSFVCYNGEY